MKQNISFYVVGVSHHTASVAERERFSLAPTESAALLSQLHQADHPALLLSTCNRFELYWTGPWNGSAWFCQFASERGVISDQSLTEYGGMAAVRHLFEVAAGLDSQILGETEILGQVRRAYEAARIAGTTTREMDLVFSAALMTGRRVRRDTILGHHPASVASATIDLVLQTWGSFYGRSVIVLGAGEAAEGLLRALHEQGASAVTLLSRQPERARLLANAWGAEVESWEALDDTLKRADLVLVATSSSRPVLTSAQLSRSISKRESKQLLLVDLGVPRNVEPEVGSFPGVQLLDLDDLQRLCCPAAGIASENLAEAYRIIDEELSRLRLSLRQYHLAPQLAELHRLGNELAEQEAAWALARLDNLSESQRDVVREMADRLVRRVLYPVSRNLREHASFQPLAPLD